MTHDCLNAHCRFFLQDEAAQCPACGRWPWRRHHQLSRWSGLALAFGLLVLVSGRWWLALVSVLVLAVVMAIQFRHQHRGAVTYTLEVRYSSALEDAARWLATWSELFTLNARSDRSTTDDERQLLIQAMAASADAAAEAIYRRDDLARRYLANDFDRLELLARSPAMDSDWDEAFAIVEHHLETLWIDQQLRQTARDHIDHYRTARRRTDLLQVVREVRLFDDCAATSDVVVEIEPQLYAEQIVDEHQRLRIERDLLRDVPRT